MFYFRCESRVNGDPLVVVITRDSANKKTGDMLQVWILPLESWRTTLCTTGNCGSCPRGAQDDYRYRDFELRKCYVQWQRAPLAIHRAYHRGAYEIWTGNAKQREALGGDGRPVRLGACGDPGVLPAKVLSRFIAQLATKNVTGYTRRWKARGTVYLRSVCMASCDSEQEQFDARSLGWRTFRARRKAERILVSELMCPASEEGGSRTTCAKCLACGGGYRELLLSPDRVIIEH